MPTRTNVRAPVSGPVVRASTTRLSIPTPRHHLRGFASAAIRPARAFWNNNLNQYNLAYDAVRTADDPEQALMDFLMSTYEAAASAGKWDRTALESPLGLPGVPRKVVWD